MMRREPLLTLSVALVLVAVPSAQPAADFSGRWTLEAPAIASTPAVPGTPAVAASAGDMGSGWGSTLTITQDAARLRVEYATSSPVVDAGAGKPFTSELTRKLWLESPTTLIVEVTRAGALGGPPSTTRAVYRKAAL